MSRVRPNALRGLLNAAAVRERAHEMLDLGARRRARRLGGRSRPARRRRPTLTAAVTREHYPDLDIPFHARWRHFVVGGATSAAGSRAGADARRGARLRSRHPLGAARRRRRAGLALSRPGDRQELRPLRRARRRQPAHVRGRRLLGRSASPLRVDAARCSADRETSRAASRSGRAIRWSASTAAPPCSAGSARRCRRGRTCSLARSRARAGSTTLLAAQADGGTPAGAGDPRSPARGARADLGGPAGDRRRRARRLLAASRRSGATTRPTASCRLHKLSQWLAYSLIEPLRGGRHRGRSTSTASPASPNIAMAGCSSIPACSRLADPGRCRRGAHRSSRPADRRLARDDRRAARPARAAGPRAARRRREALPAGPHARGRHLGGRPPDRAPKRRADGGPPFTIISDGTVF